MNSGRKTDTKWYTNKCTVCEHNTDFAMVRSFYGIKSPSACLYVNSSGDVIVAATRWGCRYWSSKDISTVDKIPQRLQEMKYKELEHFIEI